MSADTIYLRQVLSLTQAALREQIGVNLADIRQLQDVLIYKAGKFTKGVIPENEAADFARETGEKALEYGIRAGEELQRLQEEQKKPVQYSSEAEEFLSGLSEEKRNMIQSEGDKIRRLPISDMENLIAALKRLREMAWYLTAHIQDYAETPEYRERRKAFLLRGEPAPDTQLQGATVVPELTNNQCLQKLVDTGFITIAPDIRDKPNYKAHSTYTVLDVFDELAEMTGSERRARAIMFQNMAGVKSSLDRYRKKKSLKS